MEDAKDDDGQTSIDMQKEILHEQCRLYNRMKQLSNSLCHIVFDLAQKHEIDASK